MAPRPASGASSSPRDGVRLNTKGAFRVKKIGDGEDVWDLDDGSSFGAEICVATLHKDEHAYDVGLTETGEGDMRLFKVVVPKAKKTLDTSENR